MLRVLRSSPSTHEQQLVEAARRGDPHAFGRLVEPHRERLRSRCLQMLRSDQDADDALQDALVRAWRGLHGFEGGASVGPWLHRIATNSSLDALSKRRRTVPIDASADMGSTVSRETVDPVSPAALYEQREALELAFAAAQEMLPARQRAVLILSEALGYSAREAAEALDTTPTSVYSALQRARKVVDAQRPERNEQTALRALGDEELKDQAERFAHAMERDDVDAILAIVKDDDGARQRPASAARRDSTRACDSSSRSRSSRPLLAAASSR